MGAATDIEQDTESGPRGDATVRKKGLGDTQVEPWKREGGRGRKERIPLISKDQGENNHTRRNKVDIFSTRDPYIVPKASTGIHETRRFYDLL